MPRLLYILPSFLLIVTSLIIIKSIPTNTPSINTQNNFDWITYNNDRLPFIFEYPEKLLTTNQSVDSVTLSHYVNYSHPNPCNFSGTGEQNLNVLTDFNITISLQNSNLLSAVTQNHDSPWFVSENIKNGKLVESPGFIEPVSFNNLNGYKITEGVEGCGNYTYYLSVSPQQTFVVYRPIVAEFSQSYTYSQKLLTVAGIISPEQEELILNRILSSLKVITITTPTPQTNTSTWKDYSIKEYGFSFKYPKELSVKKANSQYTIFSTPYLCKVQGSASPMTEMSQIKIDLKLHTGKTFASTWEKAFGFKFTGENVYDGKKIIDGKTAYYFYQGAEMEFGRTAYLLEISPTVFLQIDSWTPSYSFECQNPSANDLRLPNLKNYDHLVLSTLKFTN